MRKRVLSLLTAIVMVLSMLPVVSLHAHATYDEEGTTYVKVNSVDEIVPNARYIIIGEYEVEGAQTDYFAMSDMTNTYDDVRVGLTATTYTDEDEPNFVMSEDQQTITLHSGSILKIRLRSATYGSHENLYRMEVDGEGYLYGFCDSYYYYNVSCCRELAVMDNTRGKTWWRFGVGENGYWQISTYMRANGTTDIVSLVFNDAYADFMSYLYVDSTRLDEDVAFFEEFTQENHTNIWLYREVCTHKASDVTHVEAAAASCTQPGTTGYWFCTCCEAFSATADFTTTIEMADTYIAPTAHNEACGHTAETLRFELDTEGSTSSSQHGTRYLFVGKSGDKYYAMGNVTNPDGSRNAVEVTMSSNGIITAASDEAEFVVMDYDNGVFGDLVDGCYLSLDGGRVIAYDKSLYNTNGYIPIPGRYVQSGEDYSGYFYAYSSMDTKNEYLVFDPENLCFRVQSERADTIYRYQELCPHKNLYSTPEVAPTCTEQGAMAYWYCDDCYRYYTDSTLEVPVEIYDESEFTKPATGHRFGSDGICTECGMTRTYYQVSTLEAFDALHEKATYIIVIKDSAKTYAAALPPANPADMDSDGDGLADPMEADTNGNGIPDCIEDYIDECWGGADADADGITTVEEYNSVLGDMTGDNLVNMEDYKRFFRDNVYWYLSDLHYEQTADSPNFVEVTMAADGTITITDENPMEFQMMVGGVWGAQEIFEEDFEYFGILTTERIRAAWVPNYWIGASGQMGYYDEEHFLTRMRIFGDGIYPGIQDHKNWKISFNADGTACLVDTWESYDNTGALQFVKYTDGDGNACMTIVGLPDWLWTDSEIMRNRTETLPVYLYAAEPVSIHTCQWGAWTPDEGGDTHTRTCTDAACGKTETKAHGWDEGTVTTEPGCETVGVKTYTCPDCGATRTEEIEALDHDWSDWAYDSADSHARYCKRNCGEEETAAHDWSDWTSADENDHHKTCSVCSGVQTESHSWDAGVVTKQPTEEEEGVTTYTCTVCGRTRTESIDKLEHVHQWSDWGAEDDGTHARSCRCGESETEAHSFGEGVVTQEPTHLAVGEIVYTCADCGHEKREEIPVLPDHQWSDWIPNDGQTHIRNCDCGESETEAHSWAEATCTTPKTCTICGATEGSEKGHDYEAVITPPTFEEQGYTTYICTVCGDSYVADYVDPLVRYDVVAGDNSEWIDQGDGAAVSVTVDADIQMFVEVWIDNQLLAPENYTVREGSTIVTLKPAYLATLPEGKYTMTIVFTDGAAEAVFSVEMPDILMGDVNEDGEVDILDANLIVAWYNETRELGEKQLLVADVNGDGEIDIMDANMIVAYYNEIIEFFPDKQFRPVMYP